jgi:hypothetical protein
LVGDRSLVDFTAKCQGKFRWQGKKFSANFARQRGPPKVNNTGTSARVSKESTDKDRQEIKERSNQRSMKFKEREIFMEFQGISGGATVERQKCDKPRQAATCTRANPQKTSPFARQISDRAERHFATNGTTNQRPRTRKPAETLGFLPTLCDVRAALSRQGVFACFGRRKGKNRRLRSLITYSQWKQMLCRKHHPLLKRRNT